MPCYGTVGAHIQLHRLLLITHLHVWLYKLHMSTLQAFNPDCASTSLAVFLLLSVAVARGSFIDPTRPIKA